MLFATFCYNSLLTIPLCNTDTAYITAKKKTTFFHTVKILHAVRSEEFDRTDTPKMKVMNMEALSLIFSNRFILVRVMVGPRVSHGNPIGICPSWDASSVQGTMDTQSPIANLK